MTIQEKLAEQQQITREWALRTNHWSPFRWIGGQRERQNWINTVRRRMKAEQEEARIEKINLQEI